MKFGVVPLFDVRDLMNSIVFLGKVDFSRFHYPTFIKKAYEMGFYHIEITSDLIYVIPGSINEKIINELMSLKDELGLSYSIHLPVWSVELASPNRHIRKASIETILECIKVFEPLQPITYVLHATGALASEFARLDAPGPYQLLINRYMQSFAAMSLEEIITRSEINPRLLALENVEFPFDLTRELVDRFNTSICYDTGHLLSGQSGKYDPIEFLRDNIDRIVEIHFHDGFHRIVNGNISRGDHLALGEGDLPYCEFLKVLIDLNYNGVIVFELNRQSIQRSLDNIKHCPGNLLDYVKFQKA